MFKESGRQQGAWNGNDASYYQWEYDAGGNTWTTAEKAVGVMFTVSPFDATLAQQTYVFNQWESGRYTDHTTGQQGVSHRLAWPVTVPECGG